MSNNQAIAIDMVPVTRHGPAYPSYAPSRVWGIKAVPTHWAQKPLKRVVSINTEKLADSTDPDYELEYVDIGNVTLTEGITSTERLRFEAAPTRARRIARHGDTIVSTVRTYLKAVAHILEPPPNLIVSTGFAVLRASEHIDHRYLYRLAQSEPFVQSVVAHSVGVSYPAINASEIGTFYIPLPPMEEQRGIAAFLDAETAKIDALVVGLPATPSGTGSLAELVKRLQEYRTALISAAVMGRFDVRTAKGGAR